MTSPIYQHNQKIGRNGEETAVLYLQAKGWQIITRNFRCPVGEIDIVARCGTTIVFVEVKARKSDYYGHPSEAVTRLKQLKIQRTAQTFFSTHKIRGEFRYDIISVLPTQIEHFENVTL